MVFFLLCCQHATVRSLSENLYWLVIDPFQSVELPEIIEEYLEHGVARCVAFNRWGTLLAGKLALSPLLQIFHTR
jgi:hypothetical protein